MLRRPVRGDHPPGAKFLVPVSPSCECVLAPARARCVRVVRFWFFSNLFARPFLLLKVASEQVLEKVCSKVYVVTHSSSRHQSEDRSGVITAWWQQSRKSDKALVT